MDRLIIGNLAEAADAEVLLNRAEIIIKQRLKNAEIILHKRIHASLARTDLLAGHAKRILAHHKEERQVIVPQIVIKSVICCYFQNSLYLYIDISDKSGLVILSGLIFCKNLSHLVEDAVLLQISIHQ